MRRLTLLFVFALGCSHVAPAPTKDVPPPWPAPHPDAGTPPAATTPAPTTTPPSRGGMYKTPGGAVIKPGTPPPVVPLHEPRSSAAGAVDRASPPPPGPQPPLNLPVPARRRLANGATVLVVERHELPLASIVVAWPFGAADEPPAHAGLAGLTADLLDEGAGGRGPLALADALARLGVHLDTDASWDATTVAATTMTRALDGFLPLLADVVARPAFADRELARVRADRITRLAEEGDLPAVVARRTLARLVYGDGRRYGLPEDGTADGLRALGRADVVAWHRDRLRPDLATIIVVGDVTVNDIVRRLDAAFAGWTAPPAPRPGHPTLPAPAARRRVVIVDRPGATQTVMRLGLPGAPRRSPDYFPCLVANAVLGGPFASRLDANLRERHGYTYAVGSEFAFRRRGGPFSVGAAVATAVTGPALQETLGELDRVRRQTIPAPELRLTKQLLERAMARAFATPPEVAEALVAQAVEGLPDDYYRTYADRIARVSAAQVHRAAARWIDPGKMAIVLVGDEQQIGGPVEALVGGYEKRDAAR